MRHRISEFLVATTLLAPASVHAAATLRADQVHEIEAAANQAMAEQHIPSIVVLVDRDGERVYAHAWGMRNVGERRDAGFFHLYWNHTG